MGLLLAMIFVLYYINGDSKWKVWLEMLIGTGGNMSGIFILDSFFDIDNQVIKMYSIGSCITSFLVGVLVLLFILSYIIKDGDMSLMLDLLTPAICGRF